MLLDVRTYTCHPGTIKQHLDIYEKFGRPQRRRSGYYGQKSKPAAVNTGAYGPQSIYNSILKKQLGLLTSKA